MPDYKRLMRRGLSERKIRIPRQGPASYFSSKIFFSLLIIVLIIGIALRGQSILGNIFKFEIKEISVINQDGEPIADAQDYFRLDTLTNRNLFTFDMNKVVQDIQARHPEIAGVSMRKQFPHRLVIVVRERKPVAIVVLQGLFSFRNVRSDTAEFHKGFYLVDKEGFVLPFKSTYTDLPKIFGTGAYELSLYQEARSQKIKRSLDLLTELKKAGIYPNYNVPQIDIREYANTIFYLNRIKIKMGADNFGKKTVVLREILAQLEETDTVPKYIDMRFESPVVKP